jgi:hypothetical protein
MKEKAVRKAEERKEKDASDRICTSSSESLFGSS